MMLWRVRDFHADDLDAAVRLWDNPAAAGGAPVFGLSDVIAAVRAREPAVVAVVGEELVGVTVATISGDTAWVMRISLAAAWRHRGIGSAMLGELERRLVAAGVHRIHCLLADEGETGALALEHSGTPPGRGWSSTRSSSRSGRGAPACSGSSAGGWCGPAPGISSAGWHGRRS